MEEIIKSNQFQKGNQYAFQPGESGNVKRYQTATELQTAIESYFKKQDDLKKPYTITGLALSLGFTSRRALLNYEEKEGYEQFHSVVEIAKSRIEEQVEQLLLTSGSVAGKIFNLKNNFNWQDAHVIQASTGNQSMDYSSLSNEEKTELHKLLKKASK